MTGESRNNLGRSSERLKAYTDAVVAIAQTLLILPLLESVADARSHHLTTGQWLLENSDAVIWMIMSFVLIGSFWIVHQRVFEHVEHPSGMLQGLNFLWLLAIVFFPVIAAVLGLDPADSVQKLLYIGCLLIGSLAMNAMVFQVNRDSRIRGELPPLHAGNMAASFGQTALYLVALVLALNISGGEGYLALMILCFMPVVVRLLVPLIRRWGWAA